MDPRRFLVAAAALLSACSGPVNAPEPRSSAPPSSPPTARWERLRALGYVSRAPVRRADRDKQGVTRHAATLSYPGLNLYTSRRRIVWSHEGQPPAALFSPTMGACQELPNGNVLITVSTSGRVLELTRDGRVAWEFFNPDIDPARRSRGVIPDMRRLPQDVARALRRGPSGHAEPDHGSSDGL